MQRVFSRNHSKGRVAFSIAVLLLVLLLLPLLAAYAVFGKIIPPNMLGLRQNYYGVPYLMSDGFSEKGLGPGLTWQIPFISYVHLLPRDFQLIHLSTETQGGGSLDLPRLEIPTTDGSRVLADITMIVRFFERPEYKAQSAEVERRDEKQVPVPEAVSGSHGGPKELVNSYTLDGQRQLRLFAAEAESALKSALSSLSTIDWYNAVLREQAAISANKAMNAAVNKDGIEVLATLIRRYTYAEKNIDDQIFAKNLQDQTERLNAALSNLAEAKAKTEETRATWDADIQVLNTRGESKVRVVDAEAAKYERSRYAEGDKLAAFAAAEVETEKNAAFGAPGGDVFVARRMLPILSTLSGGIVSDIDPFDVSSWLLKLNFKPGRPGAVPPPAAPVNGEVR